MSEQISQQGSVQAKDLRILERAVETVFIPDLGCGIKIDMTQKVARYYDHREAACDGVITFNRELTPAEKGRYYEISLKLKTEEKTGVQFYELLADTHGHDHGMRQRLQEIFQGYRLQELAQVAHDIGGSTKVLEIEGRPGWRRLQVEIQD